MDKARKQQSTWSKNSIPDFCWDRPWTIREIEHRLANASQDEWIKLAAWIMREAPFHDVWFFLSPPQVDRLFPKIKKYLKPKQEFWEYIFRTWHELGKL